MNDTTTILVTETRAIGKSGILAPAVGLGTWAIGGWMWGGSDEAESIAAIRASIDAGVSLIDTAPAYGMGRSEEIVGKAIAGRRDEVVLATKCGLVWHTAKGNHFFDQGGKPVHRYLGPESIAFELEQSLKRLRTDCIDLYITHWQDPTTPVAETLGALEDLRKAGKIRAIGASNVSPADVEAYLAAGGLDAIQEQYSMVHRDIEAELVPLCLRHRVSIISYSSLALGLLTGKIGPGRKFEGDDLRINDPRFSLDNRRKVARFVAAVQPIAQSLGATVAELVIAWTTRQPGIAFALCGARNPDQAKENARAGSLRLSDAERAGITAAATRHLTGIHV
jgi:aryl-alcohol dehydrogenase-like predicted oxidoreductase